MYIRFLPPSIGWYSPSAAQREGWLLELIWECVVFVAVFVYFSFFCGFNLFFIAKGGEYSWMAWR